MWHLNLQSVEAVGSCRSVVMSIVQAGSLPYVLCTRWKDADSSAHSSCDRICNPMLNVHLIGLSEKGLFFFRLLIGAVCVCVCV